MSLMSCKSQYVTFTGSLWTSFPPYRCSWGNADMTQRCSELISSSRADHPCRPLPHIFICSAVGLLALRYAHSLSQSLTSCSAHFFS